MIVPRWKVTDTVGKDGLGRGLEAGTVVIYDRIAFDPEFADGLRVRLVAWGDTSLRRRPVWVAATWLSSWKRERVSRRTA